MTTYKTWLRPDFVERDDERKARPWTEEDVEELRKAASGVLRMWDRYADGLREEDRVRLRRLVCALDRESY